MNHSQHTATAEVMSFQFSESKNQVRTIIEKNDIFFVGSDVAKTLGYKNSRKALNDHCKGVTKRYILTNGGKQKMNVIPEGDVFRLIINSELPSAQQFESWVMDEVLPSIRKKGYYAMHQPHRNFIDARDIPFKEKEINGFNVRFIELESGVWVSLNDVNKALHSSTASNQLAKKLNAKQVLAQKIWIFGNTHPAWFTNELGLQLVIANAGGQ